MSKGAGAAATVGACIQSFARTTSLAHGYNIIVYSLTSSGIYDNISRKGKGPH